MISKTSRINNPLTIIGLFAALSEIAMTAALGMVDADLQGVFIWFVMGFPLMLITVFFITLNFNPKVLYAPSDFKDETLFIQNMRNSNVKNETIKEKKTENIIGQTFNNKDIILDNIHHYNCKFNNCNIVYNGEGTPIIENCVFEGCYWTLDNYAANTIGYLTSMYTGMGDVGKKLVEETFDNIRKDTHPKRKLNKKN